MSNPGPPKKAIDEEKQPKLVLKNPALKPPSQEIAKPPYFRLGSYLPSGDRFSQDPKFMRLLKDFFTLSADISFLTNEMVAVINVFIGNGEFKNLHSIYTFLLLSQLRNKPRGEVRVHFEAHGHSLPLIGEMGSPDELISGDLGFIAHMDTLLEIMESIDRSIALNEALNAIETFKDCQKFRNLKYFLTFTLLKILGEGLLDEARIFLSKHHRSLPGLSPTPKSLSEILDIHPPSAMPIASSSISSSSSASLSLSSSLSSLPPKEDDVQAVEKHEHEKKLLHASSLQEKQALEALLFKFLSLGHPNDLLFQGSLAPDLQSSLFDLTNQLEASLNVRTNIILTEMVKAINRFKDSKEFPNLGPILTFFTLLVFSKEPREECEAFLKENHRILSLTLPSGSPDHPSQNPAFIEHLETLKDRLKGSINKHTQNVVFNELLEAMNQFKNDEEFPHLSNVLTMVLLNLVLVSPRKEGEAFLRKHFIAKLPYLLAPSLDSRACPEYCRFLSLGPSDALLWQADLDLALGSDLRCSLKDLLIQSVKPFHEIIVSKENLCILLINAINTFKDSKQFPNLEPLLTLDLLSVLGTGPRKECENFLVENHRTLSLTVASGSTGKLSQDPAFIKYLEALKHRLRGSINKHTQNAVFNELLEAIYKFENDEKLPGLSTILTFILIGLLGSSPREEGATFLKKHFPSLLLAKSPCAAPPAPPLNAQPDFSPSSSLSSSFSSLAAISSGPSSCSSLSLSSSLPVIPNPDEIPLPQSPQSQVPIDQLGQTLSSMRIAGGSAASYSSLSSSSLSSPSSLSSTPSTPQVRPSSVPQAQPSSEARPPSNPRRSSLLLAYNYLKNHLKGRPSPPGKAGGGSRFQRRPSR